jgi:hypothetical protein
MGINYIYKGLINGFYIWHNEQNGAVKNWMARSEEQETARISGVAKLKALGFTDSEISFFFGFEKLIELENFTSPEMPDYAPPIVHHHD